LANANYLVTVSGPRDTLEVIVEKGKQGSYSSWSNFNRDTGRHETETLHPNVFSFENFLPTPHFQTDDEAREWRLQNWGSSWDLVQPEVLYSGLIRTGSDFKFTLELKHVDEVPATFFRNLERLYPGVKTDISFQ
jgi:hypothetical protein